MKKYLKIAGYAFAGILVFLYLAFLFILPQTIKLDNYKSDLQKLVTDNTGLSIDYDNIKIITSPLLEAGVKTSNLKITLPDGSVVFSADKIKGKVFLPALLWMHVRVTCAEIDSPNLNIEIFNSEKFKVAKVYEDLVNKKREERRLNPPEELATDKNQLPFDISKIKVTVPALNLNNYSAVIDDNAAAHKLTLRGKQLKVGYFNGKKVKLKTESEFLSDEDTNITANLNVESFLPKFSPAAKDEEDDEAVFALPFINPVTEYRKYNLKSNINSKLKIKQNQKDHKIHMNGFVNIEDTTVTLSGLQLPKSHFKLQAKGTKANIDTNLFVTNNEYLKLFGDIDYGKNPYIDLSLKSSKVHFSNILNIARAYLDTAHIKNDIDNIKASGYLFSNANLKTDFTDIISSGKIIIRDGNIADKNIGLLFNDIHANLFFDDNMFKIVDTHVDVNKRPVEISGKIDSNSIANFSIKGDKIPLPSLYKAFAPKDVKQNYNLNSGFLTIDSKVTGEIKDIAAIFKADLDNLLIKDKAGNFVLSNKSLHFGVANYAGEIKGRLKNSGLNLTLQKTASVIRDDMLIADIDKGLISVNPSTVKINRTSAIKFNGTIKNYLSTPDIYFVADGSAASADLGMLLGRESIPYFDIKGNIPVKAKFTSKNDNVKFVAQAKANEANYITPVKINDLIGKQTIFQLRAEKKGDTLKLKRSGIFTKRADAKFDNNLSKNMNGAREIVGIKAIVSNLNTEPFINLFKISIPKDLDGTICIFKKSKFKFGGHLFAFGKVAKPHINGHFEVRNLTIPEVYTSVRQSNVDLGPRNIDINIMNINANGSDFNVYMKSNWDLIAKSMLSEVKVNSSVVNVDKLTKVSEAATKYVPSAPKNATAESSNIPVEIKNGSIKLNKIVSGGITATNTTGRISLFKNVFYINKLKTYVFDGQVYGDASMNLVTTELNAKVKGKEFNVEKMLDEAMQMKDTLSGNMHFIADISMKGVSMEEQMKSLKGFVDFNIKDGTLGPFGKFENFLMAENIRENAFFSSTIGSVITNLVTIDTAHFNDLFGRLTFKNGIASIAPIKSQGNVMSMYIAGDMNLLDNSADIKVRGKLASAFSDKLGPLSNINPVNLIKHTPGLNVVAAKTFAIFCQEVSEEELKAIPELGKGRTDENATKFQIVLRGDTRKPLKMIKSFKWLALNSEIQSAQDFVDTIPTPVEGEEGLSVDELIELREQQAADAQNVNIETSEEVPAKPHVMRKKNSK